MDPGTPQVTEVDGTTEVDETTEVDDDVTADDEPDFIFDVDGDTTGADPDSADPAVNIRPHEKGHFT